MSCLKKSHLANALSYSRPEAVAKYKFNEKDRPLSVLERLHAAPERVSRLDNGNAHNA